MEMMGLAERVGEQLSKQGLMLTTAESCTGGWVAQEITSVTGSSEWFERGFVTYTNVAKQEMLGVPREILQQFGAVSEETVRAMAEGALQHSHAHVALAVSGIAGPGGGSLTKPVGTVCLGWARRGAVAISRKAWFSGEREAVRRQAVEAALQGVIELLKNG